MLVLLGPVPARPEAPLAKDPSLAGVAGDVTPTATQSGPRTGGLIPGVLIGPKITATLLFPPNVMVGLELKVVGYLGASFEYRGFPKDRTISDYSIRIATTWSAGLRAYPFRGAFFVGAVVGEYDVTGSQVVGPGGQLSTLSLKGTYVGPQLGWKWAFDSGLFLGLNLGYGFSLSYSSALAPFAGDGGDLEKAQEYADKYLKPGVPVFTLLELGWLI